MIASSTSGFPAFRKLLRDDFPPFLRAADPFLRNLNPILTGLDLYKHEITAAMANVTAATNAVHLGATGDTTHYLRTLGPFSPESLATFSSRTSTNRNNAYSQPLSYKDLAARPAQLPHQPVRLGPHRLAQPRNAQRTRPSTSASKAKRRKIEKSAPTSSNG